jgi:hypothetical protein
MKIAGRYMGDIMRKASMNPYVSAAGIGGLAAGGATLGNIVFGEAAEEGPGRLGLEALGAGALGAALGAKLPAAYASARGRRRQVAEALAQEGAGRRAKIDPSTGQVYTEVGVSPDAKQAREAFLRSAKISKGIDQASLGMGILGAGALGGMIGGGVANVGQLVGIPGLQQDAAMQMAAQQAIDPESYGSSNSAGARYKAPTTQYV